METAPTTCPPDEESLPGYRFVRHPSYVGALLAVFGWALSFRSGAGPFIY